MIECIKTGLFIALIHHYKSDSKVKLIDASKMSTHLQTNSISLKNKNEMGSRQDRLWYPFMDPMYYDSLIIETLNHYLFK
jgi:hypothetical protein